MNTDAIACPSCRQPMQSHTLRDHQGVPLTLDMCFACQGLWFDSGESMRLNAASVVGLFRVIHAHSGQAHAPLSKVMSCPRCRKGLNKSFDMTRSGRYTTHRCPDRHGRFSLFSAFLIEKGFVRPLNPMEIAALAQRVGSVQCNSCGAPVNVREDSVCTYCQSPLSLLDPLAVQRALADYDQRQQQRQPPANPDAWAEALVAIERQRDRAAREERGTTAFDVDIPVVDLFAAGLALVLGGLGRD